MAKFDTYSLTALHLLCTPIPWGPLGSYRCPYLATQRYLEYVPRIIRNGPRETVELTGLSKGRPLTDYILKSTMPANRYRLTRVG